MNINQITNTSGDARLVEELIARILGQVNGRVVRAINRYKGKKENTHSDDTGATDIRLTFQHPNGKYFSHYMSKKFLKARINHYFNELITQGVKKPKVHFVMQSRSKTEVNENDLPF
jgi:hypothetical protein